MSQLCGDPALRCKLGKEGRSRFAEQFRHETMTRRIREAYERVLKADTDRRREGRKGV
jgi:hypothetical protein